MSAELDQKREAEAVKSMLNTAGWKIIEDYLISETNSLMKKLIDEDDPTKKTDYQKDIRSIQKLLNKIVMYNGIPT